MQKLLFIGLTALSCLFSCKPESTTYYLSPDGNDAQDGKSPATAWKTLERAGQARLLPGTRLFLQGGARFEGGLTLDSTDAGDPLRPVTISSYGAGVATIDAGKGFGILLHNTGGVRLHRLAVHGSGVGNNAANGIECRVDCAGCFPSNIVIDSCRVAGFHQYGILVLSEQTDRCGFQDIRITHCEATGNGEAGIASLAYYPGIPHHNIEVMHCKSWENRGISTKTQNHSGNGIVMSGVEGLRIAHCEAWENGADCHFKGGGPVGIWVWCCKNAVIDSCHSHHNRTGTLYDGGGFDIDGGASDCTIRHCRSHDNEGAGYLLCEFGCPRPFTNNLVEYCISQNDGLKNNYGGITVAGAGPDYRVNNTVIRHNQVFVHDTAAVNGTPAALYFKGTYFKGIRVEGNHFVAGGKAHILRCDTLLNTELCMFKDNTVVFPPGPFPMKATFLPSPGGDWWRSLLEGKR